MRRTFGFDGKGNRIYAAVYVTSFGALGDGSTDDTAAIQKTLDSAKESGGTIIFPSGIYLLTTSVYFYSNQKLVFEGGATLRQGAPINNLMMNYSTSSLGGYEATQNVEIVGATFDGGNYTVDNTLLGVCHSRDIIVRDCRFINSYGKWHGVEINSSKNVLIDNCYFEGSRKTDQNGEMLQIDSFNNGATWPWGNGAIDGTVSCMVEVKNCFFTDNAVSPAIGNHSSAAVNYIRIHDCVFEGLSSGRGAINFKSAKNVDVYNNTFVDCVAGVAVEATDGINAVRDNRFINVSAVGGGGIDEYSNTVNDTSTVPKTLPNPFSLSGNILGTKFSYDGSSDVDLYVQDSRPDWTKAPEKPTYTAAEVGADSAGAADAAVSAHNESETAHQDIRDAIPVVPAALPNPNKLTFTGAVTAEYDGTEAISVNIPAGGGGGTDLALGITGASAGQIAKISTVDADGKPTTWVPVAMPSGGDTWELISSAEVTEEVASIILSEDLDGEPLALKAIAIYAPLGVTASSKGQLMVYLTSGDSYMGFSGANDDLSATQRKSFWIEFASFGEYWRRLYEASPYDVGGVSGVVTGLTIRHSSGQPVTEIKITPQYGTFTAGTFYIYGVRA